MVVAAASMDDGTSGSLMRIEERARLTNNEIKSDGERRLILTLLFSHASIHHAFHTSFSVIISLPNTSTENLTSGESQ